MKKALFFFAVILSNTLFAQDLVILHTNDIHNHINGLAPETEYTPLVNDNDPTLGGFSRLAGYFNSEKEKYGNKLLVVNAGDFSMGTLFQTLEADEGFQLNLMKRIGFEYVALGNHEFDFGPNAFAKIVSNNQKLGAIPQLICTNYQRASDRSDSDFVKKFDDGTILPYQIVEKNGYKIGIFSVLGKDAFAAIPGYIDVKFDKINNVAAKTSRYLKEKEKVDLVVALSHSGVQKNKKGEWIGEDVEMGKAAPDVDVIISGHTHTLIPQLVKAGNAVVIQVECYGYYVGKLDVTFDQNRKPQFAYQMVPMNDQIVADASIQQYIDEKVANIDKNLLNGLGVKFYDPVFETGFDLTMNDKKPEVSNLGPFVADAISYYLNEKLQEGVDVVVVPTGTIRHDIDQGKYGKQNINDVFNVMPLGMSEEKIPGSPLGKIYLTGRELKKVLELILGVYHKMSDYYLFYSGIQLTYNPDKGLFRKISEIKVGDDVKGYRTVSFSKKDKTLYSVAADKYTLSFIAKLKKMSFGVVNVVGKNRDGSVIQNNNFLIDSDKTKEGIQEAKEWLAILDYVRSFSDPNGNGLPEVPTVYQTKVNPAIVKK
ncbi:MAG TPA: 5'-nucleotidase C-terminal domain-containing protein [Prolixibacteraceae bacterium]|nr:5'-nucleotidase C-terminal domain-containing protein [Prolixibacteraceae bacterium]